MSTDFSFPQWIATNAELLAIKTKYIVGERISNILRCFVIIIAGRYGINTSNAEFYQILFALMYFFSPIDIIPDFIPVIGYLDDMAIIYLASQTLWKLLQFVSNIVSLIERNIDSFSDEYKNESVNAINDSGGDICPICFGINGARNIALQPCGHTFCSSDAEQLVQRRMKCPLCRSNIRNIRNIGDSVSQS